jgi:hypothetical protein
VTAQGRDTEGHTAALHTETNLEGLDQHKALTVLHPWVHMAIISLEQLFEALATVLLLGIHDSWRSRGQGPYLVTAPPLGVHGKECPQNEFWQSLAEAHC